MGWKEQDSSSSSSTICWGVKESGGEWGLLSMGMGNGKGLLLGVGAPCEDSVWLVRDGVLVGLV